MRSHRSGVPGWCSYLQASTLAVMLAGVTACGGSDNGGGATSYTVGGSVSGVKGSGLELSLNGGSALSVAASATSFTFPSGVASGMAYTVSVAQQPSNPTQTCTVANGSGTATANVTNVSVTCTTAMFTVGGTITGLTAAGLTLQDNGGDNLTVSSGAPTFTFKTPLTTGAAYHVTVLTQPTGENCTVANGSGTVGSAKVTSVAVTCVAGFSVGGTVSGLTSGGLMLTDNGGNTLSVPANATTFTFTTGLMTGAAYDVAVSAQPSSPAQVCSVANATGTIAAANVSNVAVSCVSVGQYVYVADASDNTNADGDVAAFSINQSTGALTALAGSPFLADNNPTAVAIDRTDKLMYVSNKHSTDVSAFSIGAGGVPTLIANVGSSGTSGQVLALAPNDAQLYVGGFGTTTGSVYGYTVNTATGALTGVGSNNPAGSGNTPFGIAVDPSDSFVFATSTFQHYIWVYAIGTGGVLTNLTNSPFATTGSGPYEIAVSPLGTANGGYVYTADSATSQIDGFSYDTTGNLTALTGSPYSAGATQPEGIIIDPTGKYMFVTNFADNSISTFTLDPTSGVPTMQGSPVLSGCLTACPNPGPIDLKLDPSGQFLYVVNQTDGSVSAFTVNAGVLTLVGTYALPAGASPNGAAVY